MAVLSGKIAINFFESVLESIQDQTMLSDMCERFEPTSADMQNAGNVVWRPVEQQAPSIQGWDLTGQETGIIEEEYPAILTDPWNDLVEVRADDLRDMGFWRRRGKRSGRQQIVTQNTALANAIVRQGSQYYESNVASGFDFISEGQAILNEEQREQTERYYMLNDRSTQKFAQDLAGRQTIRGRPADTWRNGQIGSNVAEFDVFSVSFLPTLTGAADPATTVTGDQSFVPEAGSVDLDAGIVTNVDYRRATIPVAASGAYSVGDKVTFANGGTAVEAVGASDKNLIGRAKTFTIVSIPNATSVIVYPKPIALDDPALTVLERASANIDTQILNAATMNRVNTTVGNNKTNIFWDKDAVEVVSGQIPADLFAEFDGMKVLNETMPNGQTMYMVYDARLIDMTFRYRLFSWWGITIRDPQRCGTSIALP